MFRNLFSRLFATYLLVIIFVISALVVSLTYLFEQYYFSRSQQALIRQGEQLNSILAGTGEEQWENQITELERLLNARILVHRVTPEQAAALNRQDLSPYGEEHLVNDLAEIMSGEIVSRKKHYTPIMNTDVVFVGRPLILEGEIGGFILLFSPLTEIGETLGLVNRVILIHALGGILLAVLLIYLVSRGITRPLGRLEQAARQMARGSFSGRVNIGGRDELARLADSFNNMAGRLARHEEVRSELFTDLSHELRAPVTTVQGFLQALQEGVVPEAERQQYLELAFKEAGRLSGLVNDLLELAKLQSGEIIFNKMNLSLPELVRETVKVMEPLFDAKRVSLDCEAEKGEGTVFADADRLKQVLINLLENALRYTDRGGTVRVAVSSDSGWIEVRVEDSGCGIPPEELPFIFEKFYRVDRSRGLSSGGRGLGLHIVKKLVEAHGGQVAAESAPGEGSSISFRLPAVSCEA